MLLGQARRMLALPYLREFASLGLSGNAALARLAGIKIPTVTAQSFGIPEGFNLGYRRTDFYTDYRRVLGVEQSHKYVSAVGKDKALDPRRFPDMDMDIDRRYMYNVRIDMVNAWSGEVDSVYRHAYSDTALSRRGSGDEALDIFQEEYENALEYMGFNPEDWSVVDSYAVEAYHHKGWGY